MAQGAGSLPAGEDGAVADAALAALPIGPAPDADPKPRQLAEHGERVAAEAQVGLGVVAPDDGDLQDPVAESAGQPENLDVEGVAVQPLPREQGRRRRLPERLEAALAV